MKSENRYKQMVGGGRFHIISENWRIILGLKAALFISDLKLKYSIWKNNLDDDGYFYCTQEKIQEDTGLTPKQQRKIIKTLKELNVLEIKKKGVPKKSYYKINFDAEMEAIKKGATEQAKSAYTDRQKVRKRINTKTTNNYKHKEVYSYANEDKSSLDNNFSSGKIKITRRNKKPRLKNNPIDAVDNIIIEHWNKMGIPFTKANLDSHTTREAKKILEKLFRKHRSNIYKVFDRAKEHIQATSFRKTPKISLKNFLQVDPGLKRFSKFYENFKYRSWFHVFNKLSGKEIYNEFHSYRIKYPEIVTALKQRLMGITGQNDFTPLEIRNIIFASKKIKNLSDKNEISHSPFISSMERELNKNNVAREEIRINKIGFADYWDKTIPMELVDYRLFESLREIKR